MSTTRGPAAWESYLIAVLSVGLGFLLRVPAWPLLGSLDPFVTFYPAVLLSAWRGGLGPGLLSTALSAIAALYLIVEPIYSIQIVRLADAVALALFLLVGGFISWLTGRIQRTAECLADAQQSERRSRLLSEQTLAGIGDAIIATDTEGRITFMNRVAEQLTGWPFPEAESRPLETIFRIVSEGSAVTVESPVTRVLREGRVQGLANHTELIARDGRHIPIDDSSAPIRDENGILIGAVLVFRDITDRRAAEREVEASRERLRSTLESITDAFVALDKNWCLTYVNEAAERILGRSRNELVGKNHWEEFPLSRGTMVEESYRRAVAEQQAVRFEYYYPPLYVWLEVNAYPIDAGGISIYFRDITLRMRTEERDAFLVRLDDTVRPLTVAQEITYTAARLLGEQLEVDRCAYADVEPDEFTFNLTGDYNRGVPSIVGRYTIEQFGKEFARLCREGTPYVIEDIEADPRVADVRDDYRQAGIRAVISVPLLKAGRFVAGMAVHQTTPRQWQQHEVELVQAVANRSWESIERAHVTRELQDREQRFRALAQSIPQLIWTARADGSVDYLSEQWADYIGLPPERLYDWSWQEVTHSDDLPQTLREWTRSIQTGEPVDIRHRIRHRTGQWRWQLVRGLPIRNEAGQVTRWVGTCTDIQDEVEAKAALMESEARFRHLADNAPVMVWVTQADGTCTYLSRSWYEFTGQTPETGLGFGWLHATHPDDRESAERAFREANTNKGSFRVEYRLRRKDGVYRWAIDAAAPRLGPNGEFLGYVGSVLDITERREAEQAVRESEAQFRELANAVPAFVWTTDPNGALTYFNDRWYAYTGLTLEESLGSGWVSTMPPEDVERILTVWHDARARAVAYNVEARYRSVRGEYRWFMARALPVRDATGRIVQWFGTSTDIHEAKLNEDALRKAYRELEEFAYVASHDLQEPIRMVNIYTQQLLRNFVPEEPKAKEYAGYVQGGIMRMQQLINDLLKFSRAVHEGSLWVAGRADLSASLSEALSVLRERIEENQAQITAEPMPVVRGDTEQLAHVFQNLIGNSLKYRRPDVPLEICVRAAQNDGHWVIAVSDNGIGFEQQYAERIFGLFKRLHRDEYPGTGLGLAICQRTVERYGGRMWAEGRPGEGATLFFALPTAEGK